MGKLSILFIFLLLFVNSQFCHAQGGRISGKVILLGNTSKQATVSLSGINTSTVTDSLGNYILENIKAGKYQIKASSVGYHDMSKTITVNANDLLQLNFELRTNTLTIEDVVITGTLKEVSRTESPVPVEVYTPTYFKKNPTSNIFEALQNINGVRPQLNCNVCNTGDIHINGLEGPYTMVLIDGMPIVSSLSTVYGLSGIPNALVERIEIVKGPASSLYGSEAVGGLINIITKKTQSAPALSIDVFGTSWQELNADLAFKLNAGKRTSVLTGINYFNFQNIVDNNNDNFTDVTLQNRISIFQKWGVERKQQRIFSLAARYLYEDRWGGEVNWNKKFRGGDSIYGESIYTSRWEILGNYQLPTKEKLMLSFSYNQHSQDSRYGNISYIAQQNVAFSQLIWDKAVGKNDLLFGVALRHNYYTDNSSATANTLAQQPDLKNTWLPGVFVQDEISLAKKHKLLLGMRYDYNSNHGNILTPRFAYKWTVNPGNVLRLNAGTGFRVVNLFTEDHAALTGARTIQIKNELNPEKSYNANLNYIKKIYSQHGHTIGLDASLFYTYFDNRIVADFESDPNKIIYDNLAGHAVSRGMSLNADFSHGNGLKVIAGATLMENTLTANNKTTQQILTENFTGVWAISYKIRKINLGFDYTGNVYSPMRLPLLGPNDPRSAYSRWWSIQNIQLIYTGIKKVEIYGGVKNLLNWTPNKGNPFIIARSNDPFDKQVKFDGNGNALVTPDNPNGLTFDPNYVYGPNQGARVFLGFRFSMK